LDEQYRIRVTSRAASDLMKIYQYISETFQEPETALNIVNALHNEILSLNQFPYRCAPRKTGVYAGKGYRQLFVKNNTVIFRIDEKTKTVIILTVRYSSSNF
jgi:addiction module RelE/StbE family toxin